MYARRSARRRRRCRCSAAIPRATKSNCFVSFPYSLAPAASCLLSSAPPPPRRDDVSRSQRQHTVATRTRQARGARIVRLSLWADLMVMGRHAGVHCCVLLALTVLLLLAAVSDGIRPAPAAEANELVRASTAEMVVAAPSAAQGRRSSGGGKDDDALLREEEVRATGSSLPDCSHACGACSPCSRVMVSFKCSAAEPLPCPMVYRCMCRGKCYPVPSS